MTDTDAPFVPPGFVPPVALDRPDFRLRPLGPEHNASDYAAWTSSVDHIRSTPGWASEGWPHDMSLEDNRGDLERHAADFAARRGFTYTVLAPDAETVIGCVYIYPDKLGRDARILSWVRAADAALDRPLWEAVSSWIASEWPFERVAYDTRA
ncbi:MAG: N-acetyltransferase [Chloroflexota bacterium]